jgi:rod shape-determining protein MreC
MNNFYRLFLRLRVFLLFIILEVIALSLLSNSSYYQHAAIVSNARMLKSQIDGIVNDWSYYFSLKEANEQLALENNALRNRLERYLSITNAAAETVVADTLGNPVFTYIPATIVANSVNSLHNYITLNVGSKQGIEPDMGVMVHNGVIGTVVTVYEHYSLVKSLLNNNWKVSAKLSNGAFGTLHWDGKSYHEILLSEIPQHNTVNVGDTVVSSGYSDMLPSDIPVGTVKSFQIKGGNFYEIKVSLFADFKKIHTVNVVNHLYRNELKSLESPDNRHE